MRKEKSWTRQQHDRTYRRMRRGFSCEYLLDNMGVPNEVVHAADYSYQAFGCEDTGWISARRYKRFLEIKWRILITREELPF